MITGGDGIVLCVLYPSGTDLRTRIPTFKREDCMCEGTGGESGEREGSGAEEEGKPSPDVPRRSK